MVSFPLNLWSVFSTCQWLNWLQSCAVWNFNLIILFGSNQRCLGESDVLILRVGWVFSWRFCSEGRKHSIVNGQSFRLPIETTRTENLSEMFHTILGYSSWAAKRRRLKNFCVTIGWAKYPHKVENLTTQKDTPFATKAQKHQKHYYFATNLPQKWLTFSSILSIFYDFPKWKWKFGVRWIDFRFIESGKDLSRIRYDP